MRAVYPRLQAVNRRIQRMAETTVAVLEGDETGQELLEEALRVLAPEVVGLDLDLQRSDLSPRGRRAKKNAAATGAAPATRGGGLGLKAATTPPEGANAVGPP